MLDNFLEILPNILIIPTFILDIIGICQIIRHRKHDINEHIYWTLQQLELEQKNELNQKIESEINVDGYGNIINAPITQIGSLNYQAEVEALQNRKEKDKEIIYQKQLKTFNHTSFYVFIMYLILSVTLAIFTTNIEINKNFWTNELFIVTDTTIFSKILADLISLNLITYALCAIKLLRYTQKQKLSVLLTLLFCLIFFAYFTTIHVFGYTTANILTIVYCIFMIYSLSFAVSICICNTSKIDYNLKILKEILPCNLIPVFLEIGRFVITSAIEYFSS